MQEQYGLGLRRELLQSPLQLLELLLRFDLREGITPWRRLHFVDQCCDLHRLRDGGAAQHMLMEYVKCDRVVDTPRSCGSFRW